MCDHGKVPDIKCLAWLPLEEEISVVDEEQDVADGFNGHEIEGHDQETNPEALFDRLRTFLLSMALPSPTSQEGVHVWRDGNGCT